MTEPKWTAGPWVKRCQTNTVQGPEGNTVADVRYKNGENDANVIAAAPDLYEALDDFVSMGKQYGWDGATTGRQIIMKTASAALAKARGEVG